MGTSLPDLLEVCRAEARRCLGLARSVDHAAPLAHLPGWTVGHLLAHLAGDFRWATAIITDRRSRPGPSSLRSRGTALVHAFEREVEAMLVALDAAAADPDATCPNFAEGEAGTLRFWPRRQAHEATMHRWDLEVPTGAHDPIQPAVAADGIDELLAIYTARYGRQVLGAPLTVSCRDAHGAWRIEPRPDLGRGRVGVERLVEGTVVGPAGLDATVVNGTLVEGTAAGLLLALSHRLDPDAAGLRLHGDAAAARAFIAGPLVA